VYTQPAPFNKRRFFLHLATAVAVVLALVLGMSIFFKVDKEKIEVSRINTHGAAASKIEGIEMAVSGTNHYTVEQIVQASGIADGDNLLTLSKAQISGRILAKLPYVESVRVGIRLPDTVLLEIVEADVVYSVESQDGNWWLVRADGLVVEKTNAADAQGYTQLLGVKLSSPVIGKPAVAAEPEPELDEEGNPIPVTVLGSERLAAALSAAQNLEGNGFIGDIAKIDVSDMSNLQIWQGTRFQVLLGDTQQIDYKIRCFRACVDKMKDYASGVFDISFTVKADQVIYTPFA
jgi:cell division protein FtsQ